MPTTATLKAADVKRNGFTENLGTDEFVAIDDLGNVIARSDRATLERDYPNAHFFGAKDLGGNAASVEAENAGRHARTDELQAELDALWARIEVLCKTPFDPGKDYFISVLDARAHASELALRAAQSALMHAGARGYLLSSDVQRRVRESHFVAIVSPAIKHLRKEIARLSAVELPA